MKVSFLTDKNNVLYHDEQSLDAEQKARARKNIGAIATINGIAPDDSGNVQIEVPSAPDPEPDAGDIDLTGYATEQWVRDGFQIKGDYATKFEIPDVPVQSVNGKTGDVTLTAADVKARPSTWMPSAADVGALPVGTTFPVTSVNDRTGDVKLTAELVGARPYYWLPTAADIGALPASTKIPTKVSELKNDAGYLTEVPEEYAKDEDIPTKPSDIGAVATVNGVAPDDNGNVELASATSWNDLSHRPFGDKYGDTLTWDGNIYGLTGAKFSYDFAGMLYNVTRWDYEGPTAEEFSRATITVAFDTGWEQDYTDLGVIARDDGTIELITSNATSGVTFPLLVYLPHSIYGPTGSLISGLYLLRTDAGAWVKTITIPGCTKLIKTEHLNAKYLPEVESIGDVWVEDLKERIGTGAGDGAGAVSTVNGVAPDANGNVEIVTSWNDLEDRPFGEVLSDTVAWDGNTDGRSSSTFGYDSYHCTYYKVCDTALPLEEVVGQSVSCVYVNASGEEVVQSVKIYANGDLIVGGNPISKAFFVYSPGEGVFLPKDDAPTGGWIKSITIEGYNGFLSGLKKLDEKYLPDGVVKSVNGIKPDASGNVQIAVSGGSGGGGDTLIWDGNTNGLVSVNAGFVMYKISDAKIVRDDLANGFTIHIGADSDVVSAEDASAFMNEDGSLTLEGLFYIPTDNYESDGFVIPKAGWYHVDPQLTEGLIVGITIPGYTGFLSRQMEALVAAVKATFTTETFTFTLEGGEVVTKEVYVR